MDRISLLCEGTGMAGQDSLLACGFAFINSWDRGRVEFSYRKLVRHARRVWIFQLAAADRSLWLHDKMISLSSQEAALAQQCYARVTFCSPWLSDLGITSEGRVCSEDPNQDTCRGVFPRNNLHIQRMMVLYLTLGKLPHVGLSFPLGA